MLSSYALNLLKAPNLQESQQGKFSIRKITISEEQALAYNKNIWMQGDAMRRMEVGNYLGIFEGDTIWMSDTPSEIKDHVPFILAASGDVLITGLGLGMVTAACLRKEEVKSVTVIERQPDVMKLVMPAILELAKQNKKEVRVIHADAMTWKPDKMFDWAWHDIWPTISAEDAPAMEQIKHHYKNCVRKGQECWVETQVKELAAEQRFFKNPLVQSNNSIEFEEPEIGH